MEILRKILALSLVIALANYGVVATAAAHTHDDYGFHQVHVVTFDGGDHDHDHDTPVPERAAPDFDQSAPAFDHTETGFHTHSAPQFGPTDAALTLALVLVTHRTSPPDPQGLTQRHRDKPPFKPPRKTL